MPYFNKFSKVDYQIGGVQYTVRDLTEFYAIGNVDSTDYSAQYEYYTVKSSDTPSTVSMKLYGTEDHYWTFFILNRNLKNYWIDWPMSDAQLRKSLLERYPGKVGMFTDAELNNAMGLTLKQNGVNVVYTGQTSGAVGYISKVVPSLNYIQLFETRGKFNSSETITNGLGEGITLASIDKYYNAPLYFTAPDGTKTHKGGYGKNHTPYKIIDDETAKNTSHSRIKVFKPALIDSIVAKFKVNR